MFGEYAALAKWVLIIAVFSSIVYAIDNNGYQRASKRYETQLLAQAKEAEKVLNESKLEAATKTAESNAYATFIQDNYNAKVNEIKSAPVHLERNSVRENALCRGSGTDRVPQDRNSKTGAYGTTRYEAGFSPEFRAFIESQIRRDQLNVADIEAKIKVAEQLCKQPNVICE
jgi:Tfp pilus assembly protein PilE